MPAGPVQDAGQAREPVQAPSLAGRRSLARIMVSWPVSAVAGGLVAAAAVVIVRALVSSYQGYTVPDLAEGPSVPSTAGPL